MADQDVKDILTAWNLQQYITVFAGKIHFTKLSNSWLPNIVIYYYIEDNCRLLMLGTCLLVI